MISRRCCLCFVFCVYLGVCFGGGIPEDISNLDRHVDDTVLWSLMYPDNSLLVKDGNKVQEETDENKEKNNEEKTGTISAVSQDVRDVSGNEEQGRHFKKKKMMLKMLMMLKTITLGVVLPSAIALALVGAWKAVTLSLMALMLAGIVGLKGLIATATHKHKDTSAQHVILSGVPTHHQHYWKRSDAPTGTTWNDYSAHDAAYQAYR